MATTIPFTKTIPITNPTQTAPVNPSNITQSIWSQIAGGAVKTAQNYGNQITAAKNKIASSVTDGAKTMQENAPNGISNGGQIVNEVKAAGETALGAGAGAVQAIFAPISAPIQTLLSHVASSNAVNPSITGKEIDTPEAQAARDQIASWAQQHPELARTLGDAFTVGTAVVGSSAADNVLNKPIGEIAANAKTTAVNATNNVRDRISSILESANPIETKELPNPLAKEKPGASAVLMNKVARINPSDVQKFTRLSGGVQPGEFLDQRGIYGGTDKVAAQLFTRFNQSRNAVDDALAQLPGQYQNKAVDSALSDIVTHAENTSAQGAESPYLKEANYLLAKSQHQGLTMGEVNQAKRLFERTVKLNYIKDGVAAGVERANNIDSAIRVWQQQTADQLGFENIGELNKETQLSKTLIDALGKKHNAQLGNNLVGLTDWIIAGQVPTDPSALALLLGKKVFSSSNAQGTAARFLSKGEKLGAPNANVGPVKPSKFLGLPAGGESSNASNLPPVMHMQNTKLLPEDMADPKLIKAHNKLRETFGL